MYRKYFSILTVCIILFQTNLVFTKSKDFQRDEIYLQQIIKEDIKDLISNQEDGFLLFPEGTKIKKVLILEENLLLDFSNEIKNYGGSLWEENLIMGIMQSAFSYKEIQKLTIFIDGKLTNFPEGTIVNNYTRENWIKEKDKTTYE